MNDYDLFYKTLRFLRKEVPCEYPVRLRRTVVPTTIDGDCELRDGVLHVRIDKQLPEYYAIDVLLHEWGHCLAWGKDDDHHGPNWGKAYSYVYRKFLEWDG